MSHCNHWELKYEILFMYGKKKTCEMSDELDVSFILTYWCTFIVTVDFTYFLQSIHLVKERCEDRINCFYDSCGLKS